MESLRWGFNDLGFPCTVRKNAYEHGAINILFGWMLQVAMGYIDELPANSILFNLEQYSTIDLRGRYVPTVAAERFQIWDYSLANIPRWQELNPKYPPYYARVSYSPTLSRIPYRQNEDIDIVYIGSLDPRRSRSLIASCDSMNRNSLVSLSSVWGAQRDEFISRAKLLLNISNGDSQFNIFEIVRVSYYLANKKAVVCELPDEFDINIEEDMRRVLRMVPMREFGAVCDELVHDHVARKIYAEECYEVFRQRDVRQVIKEFFGD